MKANFLLYLAPLFLDLSSAAPFAHNVLTERTVQPVAARPAAVLVPVIDKRSHLPSKRTPTIIHLPSHGSHIHARAPVTLKIPKGKGKKDKDDDDNDDDKPNPDAAAVAAQREAKKKAAAEKKAEAKAKAEEAAAARAKMTQEQRDQADADLKRQKEESKKREEENKQPRADFEIRNPQDFKMAWKEFTKAKKGADGKGYVDPDDIAAAFRGCMNDDEFVFWTAGRNNGAFEKGIKNWSEKNNRKMIAMAASKCDKDLYGMSRPELITFTRKFIQDRIMDEERKKGKNGKTGVPQPSAADNIKIRDTMMYNYYWAAMSTGYAMAAKGTVWYVRPANAVDRPDSHWNKYEKPNLDKSKVKEVREVIFADAAAALADDPQPISMDIMQI